MDSQGLKALVIGAGQVGIGTAIGLLRHPDTAQVVIADADHDRAYGGTRHLAQRGIGGNSQCVATHLDVDRALDENIRSAFTGYDVVVSAIPARHNLRLADLAIQARRPFCDMGGKTSVSLEMHRKLWGLATDAGISVITDCGVEPGLGNTLAVPLIDQQPDTHEVVVYVGGFPQRPEPPHFYQRTFSVEGLLEIMQPATVLQNGAVKTVPACSGGTILQVPVLERFNTIFGRTVQTRITGGAGRGPWVFSGQGILDFREETVRWDWPALLRYIGSIPEPLRTATLERDLPPTDRNHPDLVWMRVVANSRYHTKSYELCCPYDDELGISAMAKTTGLSAAVVARLAAQRRLPAGVFVPEELGPALARECIAPLIEDLNIQYLP